jgi:hypothetical protein
LSKLEKNKKERARGSAPVFPVNSAKYIYHHGGRRTEVRFRATGVLYMLLWNVDDNLEAVAKAAHVPAHQLLTGQKI